MYFYTIANGAIQDVAVANLAVAQRESKIRESLGAIDELKSKLGSLEEALAAAHAAVRRDGKGGFSNVQERSKVEEEGREGGGSERGGIGIQD